MKWAFDGASILFAVAIVEFIPAVLETRFAISEGRYLSETEQQTFNKVFYSGVMGFAVGCVGLALVVYKLITHST